MQYTLRFDDDPVDAEIRRLGLKHTARCPVCDGAGGDCPRCEGWGRVRVGCSLRKYITGCVCSQCRRTDAELGVPVAFRSCKRGVSDECG